MLRRSKPIRTQSASRRKLMAEVGPLRAAYLLAHPNCACGCGRAATKVHEIASGPARGKALQERSTWLAVCHYCNYERLTDKTEWPIARQYALKILQDAEHYERERVNELRGRQPNAVDEKEVAKAVQAEFERRMNH